MDFRIVLSLFPIFMALMIFYIAVEVRQSNFKIRGIRDWAFSFVGLLLYSVFDTYITEYNYVLGGFLSSLFYITAFIFIQYSLSNYLESKHKFYPSIFAGAGFLLFSLANLVFQFDDGFILNIIFSSVMILIILETFIFIRTTSKLQHKRQIFPAICMSLVLLIPYFIGRIITNYDFGVNHIYHFGTIHSYLYIFNMTLLISITLGINYVYRWFYIMSIKEVNAELDLKIKEVTMLSETDQLTGIPNRRKIEGIIKNTMDELSMTVESYPFSVILIDLNNFKSINDNYGHQKGDEILVSFAELISKVLTDEDAYGRWGGDEFIILVNDTIEENAERIAKKLYQLSSKISINHDFKLSFSYGVMEYDKKMDYDEFFKTIDNRLYEQKYAHNNKESTSDKFSA